MVGRSNFAASLSVRGRCEGGTGETLLEGMGRVVELHSDSSEVVRRGRWEGGRRSKCMVGRSKCAAVLSVRGRCDGSGSVVEMLSARGRCVGAIPVAMLSARGRCDGRGEALRDGGGARWGVLCGNGFGGAVRGDRERCGEVDAGGGARGCGE